MSLPSSSSPGQPAVQKQAINVYTVMLILSFLALVTGTVLLSMELNRYGQYPWWKTPASAVGSGS
ncbi:hypothetical protein [Anatilimnocola floriformis]|uniref:hypothetical protein n=1 Tax=Anatilimnocola floriformis TaxID=2948575 RepID=UPI0020C218FB|nr:hypothetical protein [Anatilimnocola floriformis]